MLVSKSELRKQFFEKLWKDHEGIACLATTDQPNPKASFKQHFFKWPTEHGRIEQFFLYNEQRKNIYFCINLLSKMERRKEFCLKSDVLWADLDDADVTQFEDSNFLPTILVESSPGKHQAYWCLQSELPPYQAEDYSRRLAYKYGADRSGWDLTQLLRVPFTKNLKYEDRPPITIKHMLNAVAPPALFEQLPSMFLEPTDSDIPTDDSPTAEEVIYKYGVLLNATAFHALYTQEPEKDADWSALLWRLLHECFKVGMLANEVFAVARAASCNKYERDGRPLEHLWKDVIKASRSYVGGAIQSEMLVFPELTEEQHSRTFIDDYTDYGIERTDAYPEYHKLCAFVLISTLVATSIRLDTNDGTMVPNLYGLILGPSTLARKSTVMGHAMSFLMAIDPSLLVANDATPEGLLNALATRPNRASIFHRDEVSGFFNQMNRREYMSHMMEILSALYDVPPVFMRTLRKESFRIDAPVFVLLAGGVDTRVYEAAREDYVTSGFFPRFLVVSGKPTTYIPMGPPVPNAQKKNTEILNKLADIYEIYGTDVSTKLGNATAKMPPRIKAQLTQDAWIKYNEYELILKETAENSIIHDTALPTFIRFSKSILKMAVILGAVRQIPEDGIITIEESDLINAAWYAQKWGQSSVELAVQAGRHVSEKIMDKILKFIEDRPGVLKGKIMQNFGLMKKEADAFLETLEERGYIRKERRGRGFAYWIT